MATLNTEIESLKTYPYIIFYRYESSAASSSSSRQHSPPSETASESAESAISVIPAVTKDSIESKL